MRAVLAAECDCIRSPPASAGRIGRELGAAAAGKRERRDNGRSQKEHRGTEPRQCATHTLIPITAAGRIGSGLCSTRLPSSSKP